MRPETKEEKLWFFAGYFYCKAQEYAEEFGYTQAEAMEILLNTLKEDVQYDTTANRGVCCKGY